MRYSSFIIALFLSVLLPAALASAYDLVDETFVQCLTNFSSPSQPISSSIYTPKNSSYASVLQSYIRELRYNESTTPKPFLIITALHVSHVQAGIICAKKYDLVMKIRSGGHDYEGVSYVYNKPFFVLDMFNFRSINVSIEDETAWVQAGATLGEVYYNIYAKSKTHGFPAGVCPTVGVGGHFSGGGYGNMMRKYGLSVDNIVDAEIVDNIVDAEIVDVKGQLLNRKTMGEDMFWAITGGGGASFGIIISYKINLVRVPATVTVFRVARTLEQNATDLFILWQEVAPKLPEDIFIRMIINVVNSTQTGQKTVQASFVTLFLGDAYSLLSLMNQRFPELGLQRSDCTEMSWVESTLWFTNFPPGTPVEALLSRVPQGVTYGKKKSDYLQKPIPRKGLEYLFKRMIQLEIPSIQFNPYGGRMAEISEFAKPFPHRAGNIAKLQYETYWSEGGVEAANHYLTLARSLHKAFTPFVSKNPREAFFNYRDFDIGINRKNSYVEGVVYGRKYFKNNFDRLVKMKTMVDPDNFFRNEQSIPIYPSW